MRHLSIAAIAALLLTAACGTTEKTVVVTPGPGQTVIVPSNGAAHVVCTPGSRC